MNNTSTKLSRIMNNQDGFANKRQRQNFYRLRGMLISATREVDGRFNINFARTHDLAEDMARQLPPGVCLGGGDDGGNDHGPDEPGWGQTLAISAAILVIEVLLLWAFA